MKIDLTWKESMRFDASTGNHTLAMDAKAPIGKDSAMTPKELVAAGLGGCTAMDVQALFKKHKQNVKAFGLEVEIESTTGKHPAVFQGAHLTYKAEGEIDPAIFLESVKLSQTKYCGVSAMLSQSFPIRYTVVLNGSPIGEGHADFEPLKS